MTDLGLQLTTGYKVNLHRLSLYYWVTSMLLSWQAGRPLCWSKTKTSGTAVPLDQTCRYQWQCEATESSSSLGCGSQSSGPSSCQSGMSRNNSHVIKHLVGSWITLKVNKLDFWIPGDKAVQSWCRTKCGYQDIPSSQQEPLSWPTDESAKFLSPSAQEML